MKATKIVISECKLSPLVEVKPSIIHGNGLFAKDFIPEGELIHLTQFYNDQHGWINVVPNCMYNHSSKANCKIQGGAAVKNLVSYVEINKGEEILVDFTQDADLEQPEDSWIDIK